MTEQEYDELVTKYGNEYLIENSCCSEYLMEMKELDELFSSYKPLDILFRTYYGYNYNRTGKTTEPFNPCMAYFTLNGYANFVSVSEYDYVEYLKDHIDKEYFLTWISENKD